MQYHKLIEDKDALCQELDDKKFIVGKVNIEKEKIVIEKEKLELKLQKSELDLQKVLMNVEKAEMDKRNQKRLNLKTVQSRNKTSVCDCTLEK